MGMHHTTGTRAPSSHRGAHECSSVLQNSHRVLPWYPCGPVSPDDIIFQQDNDPKHTSRQTQEWFEKNGVTVLPWPASSSDMNLIEHVWDMLDQKVCSHCCLPSNLDDLWRILQEEWNNLNIGAIKGLYDSMPCRVEALKAAKGSYTCY